MTRRHFYLAAQLGTLALAGCPSPRLAPLGPFEPASVADFTALASRTMPRGHQVLRIRWRTDDGQVSVAGSGAVRMAPESLRVDMIVRLGVGRATLILTGEQVQADPVAVVEMLLPDRFALWAAYGVVRAPDSVVDVGRMIDGPRTFWRLTDASGRESIFELRGDTLAGVVRSRAGRALARLQLGRGDDGAVRRARVTDLARGAVFEVEIVNRQASEPFPDAIWRLRS